MMSSELSNWILALGGMVLLATAFGCLIVWVSRRFKVAGNDMRSLNHGTIGCTANDIAADQCVLLTVIMQQSGVRACPVCLCQAMGARYP